MAGWPDGRMAGWPDGRMAGWPDGRMAGWPDGRMAAAGGVRFHYGQYVPNPIMFQVQESLGVFAKVYAKVTGTASDLSTGIMKWFRYTWYVCNNRFALSPIGSPRKSR